VGEPRWGGGWRVRAVLLGTLLGVAGLAACGDSDLEVTSGPVPGDQPQAGAEDASGFSADPPPTGTPDTIPSSTTSSAPVCWCSTTTSSTSTTAPDDGDGDPSGGPAAVPASPYQADLSAADRSVTFVNQKRAENGRGALRVDPALQAAAEEWARQMAVDQNMRHDPARGDKMPDGYRSWGENVAYGHQPAAMDQGWWESEGHRANILNQRYDAVGIAFVRDPDGTYWAVQIFGGD
jgi:uncharacterized protein YkwD